MLSMDGITHDDNGETYKQGVNISVDIYYNQMTSHNSDFKILQKVVQMKTKIFAR